MKRFLIFTIILINIFWFKNTKACGPYYPYMEDVRFSIFSPEVFHYDEYQSFNFNSYMYFTDNKALENNNLIGQKENIKLWSQIVDKNISMSSMEEAIYSIPEKELKNSKSKNSFIRFLHENQSKEILEYLIFSKSIEKYNQIYDDPWERNRSFNLPERNKAIKTALNKAKVNTNEQLKRRWAFQAIRLAYYNGDSKSIQKSYNQYFNDKNCNDILSYWAMYFMIQTVKDATYKSYLSARVFANAADKQIILNQFSSEVNTSEILKFAQNDIEKAQIYEISAFKTFHKTLPQLKEIYKYNPTSKALCFLILREVNKLEDLILSPYYNFLGPAVTSNYSDYQDNNLYQQRITEDKAYAKELIEFLTSLKNIENPTMIKMVKAYLLSIIDENQASIKEFNQIKTQDLDIEQQKLLKRLKLFSSTKEYILRKNGELTKELKEFLMEDYDGNNDKELLFAIGREYEFLSYTKNAAIIYSLLDQTYNYNPYEFEEGNTVYWKSKNNKWTLWLDFYTDYIFYMDAEYTPGQIEEYINFLNQNHTDNFYLWIQERTTNDMNRLYDLLGTKYIRLNKLPEAKACFSKVEKTFYQEYPFSTYLDANPFYADFYSSHTKTKADTVKYNKLEITTLLMNYIKESENPNNKNRDYYAFLVGNCYYNMSHFGNSWMMRRYYWTINDESRGLEDDQEYYDNQLAIKYYQKAAKLSSNKKFSALCLRMAVKCESFNNNFFYYYLEDTSGVSKSHKYYDNLYRQYPEYADELVSNCNSFNIYLKSRQ